MHHLPIDCGYPGQGFRVYCMSDLDFQWFTITRLKP